MIIGYLLQEGVPNILEPPFDGPANHVREICFGLMKLGHSVKVLAKIEGDIWYTEDLKSFEKVVDRDSVPPLFKLLYLARRVQYKLKAPIAHFPEKLQFVRAVKKYLSDCDVFYERTGWKGYGGGQAAEALGTPLVLELNGDHLSELEMLGMLPGERQIDLSKRLIQKAISQSTQIVSAGDGWKRKFLDRWDYDEEKITIVENGSQLVPLFERSNLQAFQPSQPDEIQLIYIGAFHTWHGIDVGIKAFSKAVKQNPNMQLALIGSGPQEDELVKLVDELELNDKVDFLGYLRPEDMLPHLEKAHIGLSPYCGRAEFSGLKLLDYKAAGLAVIASGKDGQPAVIKDGETGCVVLPCDVDQLAEAIVYLSKNRDLCQKMGQTARIEAEQFHGWSYAAKEVEAVLNQAVGR